MRKIYNKISVKSFRWSSASVFLLGDISIGYYLYQNIYEKLSILQKSPMFQKAMDDAIKKAQTPMPPQLKEHFAELVSQGFLFFISLIIIFNLLVNIFYLFEKRFAYLYFRFLSFCMTLVACALLFSEISFSNFYAPIFLILSIGYIFNFSGFFYFPIMKKAKEAN